MVIYVSVSMYSGDHEEHACGGGERRREHFSHYRAEPEERTTLLVTGLYEVIRKGPSKYMVQQVYA